MIEFQAKVTCSYCPIEFIVWMDIGNLRIGKGGSIEFKENDWILPEGLKWVPYYMSEQSRICCDKCAEEHRY